ncbi:recombination-associated protein RdgC [Paludibacterium yongneupense]|uniref:recombination-associated protein RdgC n=1 Tax=Paludibacterium yongneupense TaxID=400061 RepID=UPI00042999A2|nr:recombination-associated protein RdgC [Paludibacterium yongneupense]
MWFKQLSFYRLNGDSIPEVAQLVDALEKTPFTHCGGLDWFGEGWVSPAGHLDTPVFSAQGCLLVSLKREDKVLPSSVIREWVETKASEIEEREFRKVGRKEKLALKEQVTDDLLPRAFVRPSRLSAYIDAERGWLMVDSGTASKAEALVSKLREALPPFPAALPRTLIAPHTAMTDWLAGGEAPAGFELDAECELKDGSSENGAVIRCVRMDLTADEIRQHIATGKQATRLGLIWKERIRFVLTDTLQLKRIQFLDVLQDEASQAGDDSASLFEATFTLMAGELGELVDALIESLGGLEASQLQPGGASAPQPAPAPQAPAAPAADDDQGLPWRV